jgi:hypothetical protein
MTRADNTVPSPDFRVIYESSPIDALDSAEETQRRAEVFAQSDRAEVAIVDGFGAQIMVERGHLELRDGVGPDRRLRRYSKIVPPLRVVVGIETVGGRFEGPYHLSPREITKCPRQELNLRHLI